MSRYKKTLLITGIIDTPYGPKLTHEFMYTDTDKDPYDSFSDQLKEPMVKDKVYVPKEGDRIYFSPSCNIPRFKFKEYAKERKITSVKYLVRANVIIVGPESYGDFFDLQTYDWVDFNDFSRWLDKIFPIADMRSIQIRHDLKSVVENTDRVLFKGSSYEELSDDDTPFVIKPPVREKNGKFLQVRDEFLLEPLREMESPNSKFYNQDDILKDLNTGIIINQEIYENISDLFESTDTENTRVAMEIIANSNFDKSAFYLLTLVSQYGDKMNKSPHKTLVNFKAFIKYFGIEEMWRFGVDKIIDSLICKNLLSNEILSLFLPSIKAKMTQSKGFKHFKVSEIAISEQMKEAIEKYEQLNKKPEGTSVGVINELVNKEEALIETIPQDTNLNFDL